MTTTQVATLPTSAETSVAPVKGASYEPGTLFMLRGVEYRYMRVDDTAKTPTHILFGVESAPDKDGSKERKITERDLCRSGSEWYVQTGTDVWSKLDMAVLNYTMSVWTLADTVVEAQTYGVSLESIAERYSVVNGQASVLSKQSLQSYASVARAYPPELRRWGSLSISHYMACMALPQEDRIELLSLAEANHTKVKELRAQKQQREQENKKRAEEAKEKSGTLADTGRKKNGRPTGSASTPTGKTAQEKDRTPEPVKATGTETAPSDTATAGNHVPVSVAKMPEPIWVDGYRLILSAPLSAEFRQTFRPNGNGTEVLMVLETAIRGMIDTYRAEQKAAAVKNAVEFKADKPAKNGTKSAPLPSRALDPDTATANRMSGLDIRQ